VATPHLVLVEMLETAFLILFQGHLKLIVEEEVEEFMEQVQRRVGFLEQGVRAVEETGVTRVTEVQPRTMAAAAVEHAMPTEPLQQVAMDTKESS
jgi:hypothetical protein